MFNIPTSLSEFCLTLPSRHFQGRPFPLSRNVSQSAPLIQIQSLRPFSPLCKSPKKKQKLMTRLRGFCLKHHVFRFFRRRRRGCRCPSATYRRRPFSSLLTWTQRIRAKARAIILGGTRRYIRVGQDPDPIQNGHVAVYVGQKEGGYERVLVPVVYFNHPLFGDLLRESEKEYGFNHPGGITIPCRISEFERVQTRIQCAAAVRRRLPPWKKS